MTRIDMKTVNQLLLNDDVFDLLFIQENFKKDSFDQQK